jgi:hypothetical protein
MNPSTIEIGHRHRGTAPVNATAVRVLACAAGAMIAPAPGAGAYPHLSCARRAGSARCGR